MNVYGLEGFNYMIRAAEKTELSVRYMIPSCVPATPLEDSGAIVNAFDMQWPMGDRHVPGLGEFMNYPGVYNKEEEALNKILVALNMNKVIDGHSPGLTGAELNAYSAAGIKTDHECSTIKEMEERLQRGMYVQMRDGSACHDLQYLIPAITPFNYKRCLLCSDDRQPKTISLPTRPDFLRSAASRMAWMDSSLASPMNPQVLSSRTSTGSSTPSGTISYDCPTWARRCSVSTVFLEHPSVTTCNLLFIGRIR